MKGLDNYAAASLVKVFEDINKLIVEGSLAVGNHSIVLDFVLGSDYKVIVIIIIIHVQH